MSSTDMSFSNKLIVLFLNISDGRLNIISFGFKDDEFVLYASESIGLPEELRPIKEFLSGGKFGSVNSSPSFRVGLVSL